MSASDDQIEAGFGMRFNPQTVVSRRGSTSAGCPPWANRLQVEDWHRRGVVIWQDADQRLAVLSGTAALAYLGKLRRTADWEEAGLSLTRRGTVLHLPQQPRRTRKKAAEPDAVLSESRSEEVNEEIMHLNPQETRQLLDVLQQNEAALRQIAQAEEEAYTRALSEIYSWLFKGFQEREYREFKWADRPLPWVRDEALWQSTCELPPNRATVIAVKDLFLLYWDVCIDRPRPRQSGYKRFVRLEEAVIWAEQKLPLTGEEDAQAEEKMQSATASVPSGPLIDLEPYRIDPGALEPEYLTYRVVIELDATPEHYKEMELLCGRKLRYDARYPTVRRLAADLQIDQALCELEQPAGSNDAWNRGYSPVTYYRESVAIEQAQLMWNKSRIATYCRRGQLVLRARYGIQEVETGYIEWLGACADPEHPWEKPLRRTDYMAQKAEELTLAHALDVAGFRAFIGIPASELDDTRLLSALHRGRARSHAIPAAARAESERWLREHEALKR